MQINGSPRFMAMAEAVLLRGLQLSFKAGGSSMSPFIRDSETVIIEPLTSSLRIGDIVLFVSAEQKLMLHRIIKKTAGGYLTKGDANSHHDGIVPHGAVLGRAVHVVGGLNFHLRFPLNAFVALALSLRNRPMLFSLLSKPGRLLLAKLRSKDDFDSSTKVAISD